MIVTKRIRYDENNNIVSERKLGEHGQFANTKKEIEYDEAGNVISIRQKVELGDPTKTNTVQDSLTEFEYENYDGKWVLNKVVRDGRVEQQTEHRKKYIAANGDEEDDSKSSIFIYSDYVNPETNSKTLVNIISFDTYQITPEVLEVLKEKKLISPYITLPEKFDTFSVQTEGYESVKEENVKVNLGSTNYACYSKKTIWSENGEGSVLETYWVECEDSTESERHFKEYANQYTIDVDYNVLETTLKDDFTSDLIIRGNNYCCRKIYNEAADATFYFTELTEEREYGLVDVHIATDENNEVIAKTEALNSTQKIINQIAYKIVDGEKIKLNPIATDYIKVGLQYLPERIYNEKDDGSFAEEKFMYDSLGRIMMKTVHHKDTIDGNVSEFEGHIIYEYDHKGNCITEITENSMTRYIYDHNNRKVFSIDQVDYPQAKEIFDFFYNTVLQSIIEED